MNNNMEFNTKVNHEYGVDQISSLEGLAAVRKRPGMYVGSTSSPGGGLTTMVREITDNSIDEYTAGFGNNIDVHIFKDSSVRVIDHGRGIPVGPHPTWKNPDGTPMNTLTGILTKLHAGGKFGGDSGYIQSSGLHGVGSSCVLALSEYFIATVKRDGKIYQQKFEKSVPITDVEIIGETNETGTTIEYKPDSEIFKHGITPSCTLLRNKFDEITSLNAGLKIQYENEITGIKKEFYHKDGIVSYVKTLVKDRKLLFDEPFYFNNNIEVKEANKVVNCEVAFIYDDEDKPYELFKTFANNVNTIEGGYHLTGCRDGLKKELNKFIMSNNLSKQDIELRYLVDGITCIISVRLSEAEFEGQTKGKLASEEAKIAMISAFELAFEDFSKSRKEDIKLIVERAIRVKAAEEAARKARQNARAANKAAKTALPGKLADCANKNGYTEIYFVEGESASGSAKMGRFSKFQAILPLRGKVLNVEKVDISRVLDSDVIKSIIAAVGTGIGNNFDIKKLRYDKLLIMTDADVDGSHIRILLLTFFYNYMRPLLEDGYVYCTQPPLYRVEFTNKKYEYVKDDEALKELKKKHGKKIADVQRFKG